MEFDLCSGGGGKSIFERLVGADPETRSRFLVRAVAEEAIASSQLEGAATSHEVALDMIRSGRRPANKDEQMIFNNLEGMEFIRAHKDDPLTPGLVLSADSPGRGIAGGRDPGLRTPRPASPPGSSSSD